MVNRCDCETQNEMPSNVFVQNLANSECIYVASIGQHVQTTSNTCRHFASKKK